MASVWREVSGGYYHTCGVRPSGSVECWGSNMNGQTTAPSGTFSSVSAGDYHSCSVHTSGAVACWGYNDYGKTTVPP